jgi:HEAT repeat protein
MTALPGYNQSSPTIGAWIIAGLCLFAGADTAVAQTQSSGGPTPSLEDERPEASDEPTITEQIIWTFSGYHSSTQPGPLLEFGSRQEVVAALKDVASDAQMRPSIRLRAVDALGRIGGDEATAFLETLLETSGAETTSARAQRVAQLLRMHAISGLGRALEDDAAARRLEDLWSGADVQARLAIVEALGVHAGTEGRKALGRLVEHVDEDLVKEKIGAHLSR